MSFIVKTNFVRPVGSLVLPLVIILSLVLIVVIAISTWLYIDLLSVRDEAIGKYEYLSTLKSKQMKLNLDGGNGVAIEDIVRLRKRAADVNDIVGSHGMPLIVILSRLEKMLPDNVYLLSIHHKKMLSDLKITAVSKNVDDLTNFLQRLEDDQYFSSVKLKRRSQNNVNDGDVKFDIEIREQVLR